MPYKGFWKMLKGIIGTLSLIVTCFISACIYASLSAF
uniref:Lipoprotein n=1 Tax=Rhizophora mucronata TaxID=61149 RepID=A0A2P2J1S3_RHIMU